MTELLCCPFCGESNVGFGRTGQKWQTVSCDECGAEGPCTEINRDLIIAKWNTRALLAHVERLPSSDAAEGGDKIIPEQCAKIALSHIGAGPDGEAYDEACRDIAEAIRTTFVKP